MLVLEHRTLDLSWVVIVPGRIALTEEYDGSSWTEVADLSTARNAVAKSGAGSGTTNAILVGGNAPPVSNATEEWDASPAASSFTSS